MPRPPFAARLLPFIAFTAAIAPLFAVACSSARYSTEPGAPTLVVPAHFAEGTGEPGAVGVAPVPSLHPPAPPAATPSSSPSSPPPSSSSSAAPALTAPAPTPSTAPDPPALRMAEQVEYELELSDGKIRVVSVKPIKLAAPIVTPRRIGRYAIELSIGHELIERLRFDFPATAADEPQLGAKKPLFSPLTLSEHAIAHVTLRLPQSPRVRRAILVDRGLNTAIDVDWPLPEVPKPAPVSSVTAKAVSSAVPAVPSPAAAPSSPHS